MRELAERRQAECEIWAAGDYDVIARPDLGRRCPDRAPLDVRPGEDVLDVACGTGNAAVRAAAARGRVVGIDLVPEMFAAARAGAAHAGVDVEWIQGDAQALPFADESFDVVVSTFGAMFAPRHEAVAGELVRVVRTDGRIGLCNWTPEGNVGEFFRLVSRHLPPPVGPAPTLWGSGDHVRELLDATGLELTFERELVTLRFDSVEHAVETYANKFGPVVKAREHLKPAGRWIALRRDLAAMFERHNEATDGTVGFTGEYLVVIACAPN